MKPIAALASRDGTKWIVTSPQPGWFRPAIANGETIVPGRVLGELVVLGRRLRVVAPDVSGIASAPNDRPRAVSYGDVLVEIAQAATSRESTTRDPPRVTTRKLGGEAARAPVDPARLVFRAPTSGRYYARPSADKPPFVVVGGELAPGATVCLLEVMKTFHRVAYGGAGFPERARVKELLVADGADVNAGEPLLVLEPQ